MNLKRNDKPDPIYCSLVNICLHCQVYIVCLLTDRKTSLRSFNDKELDFKNCGALTALYTVLFSNC